MAVAAPASGQGALFPGRAPRVLICPILLLNPVISCRTGCLVEKGVGVGDGGITAPADET